MTIILTHTRPLAGIASKEQLPDSLRDQCGLATHPKAKIQIIYSGIAPHFLNYNPDSAKAYLQIAISLADNVILKCKRNSHTMPLMHKICYQVF